jgi:hypothetical protein
MRRDIEQIQGVIANQAGWHVYSLRGVTHITWVRGRHIKEARVFPQKVAEELLPALEEWTGLTLSFLPLPCPTTN